MVTEIARLTIDPTRAADFEAAVAQAEPLFRAIQAAPASLWNGWWRSRRSIIWSLAG